MTAIPEVNQLQKGITLSPGMRRVWIGTNVVLQLIGSVMSHLIATWYGPGKYLYTLFELNYERIACSQTLLVFSVPSFSIFQ